ncbi:MAG: phosphohydrolase [Lachnospiraceae bacterium]
MKRKYHNNRNKLNNWQKFKYNINRRRKSHNYDRPQFEGAIRDLLNTRVVQQMKQYNHHSHTSCFTHSMHVAFYNFKLCKFFGLDDQAGAKGGLLHDLFLYDWHNRKVTLDKDLHGFSHPYTALRNSKKHFKLSPKESDIIEKHMFPLTPRFPKYKETVIIILTDKFCSICEVMDRFFKRAK